jgi:alkaline phosphatase D
MSAIQALRTAVHHTRLALPLALALLVGHASEATQGGLPARAKLRSGPMLGYAELTETVVWLQTAAPARAQLRFWEQGRPETARLSREVATSEEGDHLARFVLSGLAFGTHYDYEVYLDGERLELGYPTNFQTQPMWRWRTDPPDFRVALGSCAYVNDPPFDRPGTPYGSGYGIFATLAAQRPDLMLWLGDNIYHREADWLTETAMRSRYAHNRALPELQPLLASTHHYALWDDHDYGPNDSDWTFRGREETLRVFRDYWANPGYGIREAPGAFTRFEWGDVEFFLLDNRSFRTPPGLDEDEGTFMWGATQRRWLEQSLLSSDATFKVVVNGNQILNPFTGRETMARYPTERDQFLAFLERHRISGVVFATGDRHFAELLVRERPGLYPLYEFTTSPLTAGAGPRPEETDNPARVPGTWVVGQHNFGLFEVTGPKDQRMLVMRLLDTQGVELWRKELTAAELQVGSRDERPAAAETPLSVEDITIEEAAAQAPPVAPEADAGAPPPPSP